MLSTTTVLVCTGICYVSKKGLISVTTTITVNTTMQYNGNYRPNKENIGLNGAGKFSFNGLNIRGTAIPSLTRKYGKIVWTAVCYVLVVVVDHTFSVLSLQLKKLR